MEFYQDNLEAVDCQQEKIIDQYIQQFLIQKENQPNLWDVKQQNQKINYQILEDLSQFYPSQEETKKSTQLISKFSQDYVQDFLIKIRRRKRHRFNGRKFDHNCIKKVNSFIILCANLVSNQKYFTALRKCIYRYDILIVVLLVLEKQGVIQRFESLYRQHQQISVRQRNKFLKNCQCMQVSQFYKRTLISLRKFNISDIDDSINILYDKDHMKSKIYLNESKERILLLFEQTCKIDICKQYVKKRNKLSCRQKN